MAWNNRPKECTVDEMARVLYAPETAQAILQELARRKLITVLEEPERYANQSVSEERDLLMGGLDEIYRRELVRISHMIHAKAPSSVREFARAFCGANKAGPWLLGAILRFFPHPGGHPQERLPQSRLICLSLEISRGVSRALKNYNQVVAPRRWD